MAQNERFLLENISFDLARNRALGIIGKSGAGKSLLLKSLICLIDKNCVLSAEKLVIRGLYPLNLNAKDLRLFRKKVGFIFQDARASFHPLLNMGEIFEIFLKEDSRLSKKGRKDLAFLWLKRLGMRDCELIWHSYSYQLSAGMAMRVQMALALALGAEILLLDEPTSPLDSVNIANLICILKELKKEKSLLIISHDLGFVREVSDEIMVVENGKIIEKDLNANFFNAPKSAYAKEILKIYKESQCF